MKTVAAPAFAAWAGLAGSGAMATGTEAPPTAGKGVGPVGHVELGPIDRELAERGGAIFESKCTPCHRLEERYVGPALQGVTRRRTPEWIMNMILDPQGMLQEDPVAQELLAEYPAVMTYQNVSREDTRAILEHFRRADAKAEPEGEEG